MDNAGNANIIILSCIKYKNGNKSYKHESKSWDNIKVSVLFIV